MAALEPKRVADVGCATGLWLEELDRLLPADVTFIGIDSDRTALTEAADRAKSWSRPAEFRQLDIETNPRELPEVDLALLFNVSPYFEDIRAVLAHLLAASATVAIRQYDGATMRFGPMSSEDRTLVEGSLQSAVIASDQFRHYDLDRLLDAISNAQAQTCQLDFELFSRFAPFPDEFLDYFNATLDWTEQQLSDLALSRLKAWRSSDRAERAYFTEVDLVALMS